VTSERASPFAGHGPLSLVMAPFSLVMALLSMVVAPFRWSWPPFRWSWPPFAGHGPLSLVMAPLSLVMASLLLSAFFVYLHFFFVRAISLYMVQICKNMFSIYFWGLKKFARRKIFK
jgi:hypothetical protein